MGVGAVRTERALRGGHARPLFDFAQRLPTAICPPVL
jgi:hypothetical protein